MDADTMTAASAVAIAIGALVVSVVQTRAIMLHNRQSVRPILQIRRNRKYDSPGAGLRIINSGPGPAVITKTIVMFDGQVVGPWDRESVRSITDGMPHKPQLNSLDGAVLGPGYDGYLLRLDSYEREEHGWFWELISERLQLTVHYESLYGGEDYVVIKRTAKA